MTEVSKGPFLLVCHMHQCKGLVQGETVKAFWDLAYVAILRSRLDNVNTTEQSQHSPQEKLHFKV